MKIEYDTRKDASNLQKHGVSLVQAEDFEWDTAVVWDDVRCDYGEPRGCALGYIGKRLYFAAFVDRGGRRRIISLRKANRREINHYAQA
ncbi:BrnT family toxin [Candidatus Thiosymbion oneisti]|uniref:BrnT family toxin n=1 Tax=Candidatus Thiosymbion oneisti TaxID=589554 RepID=UPI000AA3A43F|nr:BrnT family toxin [Candidatus Thiosymbion oneisti]